MFYIIETEQQFTDFTNLSIKEHFIYPVYEDNRVYPTLNKVIFLYVYSYYLNKSFIINLLHPDCTNVTEDLVKTWCLDQPSIHTANGKLLLHWLGKTNLIDLSFSDQHMDVFVDETVKWHYLIHKSTRIVNKIIPISIHKRYLDTLIPKIKSKSNVESTDIQTRMLYVFYSIEKYGINIDTKLFKKINNDIDVSIHSSNNKLYGWYNLYNVTTRPTNTFNSINFTALDKSSGIRSAIIAEDNSVLVEIDFKAYHMYLLAELIDYKVTENINTWLAKQYFNTDNPSEEEYAQSKGISYKAIYTNSTEYDHIDFIKRCKDYKEQLFKESDGSLKKGQILAHKLQQVETERNSEILENVINQIECSKSNITIMLYTYDSILFNVPKNEKNNFSEIYNIINSDKYPVKVTYGQNYAEMKEI